MIATEAMPLELAEEVMPTNRTGGDTKRALYAFRRSPDGRRIVFAGRAKFRDIDERAAARILHGFMCGVWPQLRDVRISHCWKGFVAFIRHSTSAIMRLDGAAAVVTGGGTGVGARPLFDLRARAPMSS